LIIGAIALLGFGLYMLYQNWETVWSGIKAITATAGEFIKGIFTSIGGFFGKLIDGAVSIAKAWYEWNLPLQAVVATIKGILIFFDILLHVMIGLFILALPYIQAGVEAIKNFFAGLRDIIMPIIETIRNAISFGLVTALDFLRTKWQEVWSSMVAFFSPIIANFKQGFDEFASKATGAFEIAKQGAKGFANFFLGVAETVANGWIFMVNAIINALNKIQVSIPDWVPKYGGRSFGVNLENADNVEIPRLAKGGIATKSTLANIGEAGPEAIIPLSKLHQFGGVGQTIIVQIDTMVGTDEFAESMGDRFIDVLKRNQIVSA
jgi:phage-related protein